MTHAELIAYGCEFCKREDRHGETKSGYWVDSAVCN